MKKHWGKWVFLALVLVLIGRELEWYSFQLFRSYSETNSRLIHQFKKQVLTPGPEYDHIGSINLDQGRPFQLYFTGLDYTEINSDTLPSNAVLVNVSHYAEISPARYVPLVKKVGFEFSGVFELAAVVEHLGKQHPVYLEGNFRYSGNSMVYGTIAGRTVEQKIREGEMKYVRKSISKILNSELEQFDSGTYPEKLTGAQEYTRFGQLALELEQAALKDRDDEAR